MTTIMTTPFNKHQLKQFYDGYIACAYWADEDTIDNLMLEEEFRAQAQTDCSNFISTNQNTLKAYLITGNTMEQAGHDFWLTRQRHGAGFWNRNLGIIGEQLTRAAQRFKEL